MRMLWTERDLDIVESLTRRLRMLSIEQLRSIWWPGAQGLRIVRRRMRTLAAAGLIERRIVNVSVLPQLRAPLITWGPGDKPPDHGEIASRAQRRFQSCASVPQEIVSATRRAANLYGSAVFGLPPVHHRDHDLLLGEVYVHYRCARPKEALDWRAPSSLAGDDDLPRADAVLFGTDQSAYRLIESAGRGSPKSIERFHNRCLSAACPYELW